jgi:hypothetical protein
MTKIESNTFAQACYDMNSIEELEDALKGDADETDMKTWCICSEEWRDQVELALAEKRDNEGSI